MGLQSDRLAVAALAVETEVPDDGLEPVAYVAMSSPGEQVQYDTEFVIPVEVGVDETPADVHLDLYPDKGLAPSDAGSPPDGCGWLRTNTVVVAWVLKCDFTGVTAADSQRLDVAFRATQPDITLAVAAYATPAGGERAGPATISVVVAPIGIVVPPPPACADPGRAPGPSIVIPWPPTCARQVGLPGRCRARLAGRCDR